MLVLTRSIGEEITIGDDVRIKILGIRGRRVQIGFIAPDSTLIRRAEVLLPELSEAQDIVLCEAGY